MKNKTVQDPDATIKKMNDKLSIVKKTNNGLSKGSGLIYLYV